MWGFVLLVLLYKVGDAFALSLYSTFMIKGVGFSLDELSIAGKVNMTVSTMIGVAFGGWIYMRWGTFRSLLVFGIGQALTNLLYMWLALAGKKVWLLVLATSLDTMHRRHGAGGIRGVSGVAVQRQFQRHSVRVAVGAREPCRGRHGVGRGHRRVRSIGWANFFVITFLTAMPGLILLVILRQPHECSSRAAQSTAKRAGLSFPDE